MANNDDILGWKWGQMQAGKYGAAARSGRGGVSWSSYWTTLTATGTGAGVSTLKITASENITATVDGNAHFYTDAAGTLGESQTWNITTGAERTIYVKCTSGSSTLKFSKPLAVTSYTWQGSTNSVSMSVDVSKYVNLTHIQFEGINTAYGDITELTGLDYCLALSNNTIGGDITNLVDLVWLFIDQFGATTGTFTGDVTNLTKLYSFELWHSHITCSGDISGMTAMYNFYMVSPEGYNQNTMTGSLSAMDDLIIFVDDSALSSYSGDMDGSAMTGTLRLTGLLHTVSCDFGASGISNKLGQGWLASCGVDTYTAGATWKNSSWMINPIAPYGLSQAEVDNVLIDMAASTLLVNKDIVLKGTNAVRSTASDAAVATLNSRGNAIDAHLIPFAVTTKGTGAGVAVIVMQVSADTVLTLNGAARFYSDAAGTLNESTTWTCTAGAVRTYYIKCPSGTSTLTFSNNNNVIKWGTTTDGWQSYTGNHPTLSGDVASLPYLTSLHIEGNNILTGNVANLSSLTYLFVDSTTTIYGSIAGLTGLTVLRVKGSNKLKGSIAALTNLTYVILEGSNAVSGSISNLVNLTNFTNLSSLNTLSGTIASMASLVLFKVSYSPNIAFDVADTPATVTTFDLNLSSVGDYTSGHSFSNSMNYFRINPIVGLSATEVDNLLIDLSASAWAGASRTCWLAGNNTARTSASDAAVSNLQGKSVTVTTN